VKTLSNDEREALLHESEIQKHDALAIADESSTDHDSMDEYIDEKEREKNGIARIPSKHIDVDSDSETLANRKQKLFKKRK
jgi:hypothetical protein